jgi:hypothetical protein
MIPTATHRACRPVFPAFPVFPDRHPSQGATRTPAVPFNRK